MPILKINPHDLRKSRLFSLAEYAERAEFFCFWLFAVRTLREVWLWPFPTCVIPAERSAVPESHLFGHIPEGVSRDKVEI